MKVLLTGPSKHVVTNESELANMDFDTAKKEGMPTLSLYYLASQLRESGHSVNILDPALHEIKFTATDGVGLANPSKHDFFKFADAASKNHKIRFSKLEKQINDVDIIGISTTSLEWFLAKAMIEQIKSRDPDIPIIAGGVHPTYADEHILKTSKVDYVVRKEGEKTLPELLDAIEKTKNFKDIPGITYKDKINGKINRNEDRPPLTISEMEEMPLPAFDLLPSNLYGRIGVELSRGCKGSCAFCSIPFKQFWRGISPKIAQKRVEHALEHTKKLFGDEKVIFFTDDTFTTDRKRAEQILHDFVEVDFGDVRVAFTARGNDLLNSRIIELCTKVPHNLIEVGVECGYDGGLKEIGKGITTKNVEKCASIAKNYGILICYTFILGFPWESKEDCLKTVDFIYKLVSNYDGVAFVNWFHLMPGSYMWKYRKLYGIDYDMDLYDSAYMESKEVRLKLSSQLKEEDFIEIDKQIENYKFLLLLQANKEGGGYIQKTLSYSDFVKIFNLNESNLQLSKFYYNV